MLATESSGGYGPKSTPRLTAEPEERRDLELARKAGVSLKRWHGWEPKQTTRVTEWRDGIPAKWVTETEPEFDPVERDAWYALDEYEDSLCPQCRRPQIVCQDPEQDWYPQRYECLATQAQMMAQRKFTKLHEKEKPDEDGHHPADGVIVWVAEDDLSPDDNFLGEV